jgi:hypothetical protein
MAIQIALRTDKEFDLVKDFLETRGYSGFCVRETTEGGNNEHYHWFLEGDKYKNMQVFRVNLTKTVPGLKGNGAYSAKQCDADVEKYWRYMCKGEAEGAGPEVAWKHGLLWTDERFEELHQAYWANAPQARKRKLPAVADTVFETCRAKRVAWDDRRTIFEEYIKELYSRDKPINLFMIRSNVNLLQLKLAPNVDDGVQLLLNQVALL